MDGAGFDDQPGDVLGQIRRIVTQRHGPNSGAEPADEAAIGRAADANNRAAQAPAATSASAPPQAAQPRRPTPLLLKKRIFDQPAPPPVPAKPLRRLNLSDVPSQIYEAPTDQITPETASLPDISRDALDLVTLLREIVQDEVRRAVDADLAEIVRQEIRQSLKNAPPKSRATPYEKAPSN